ncbi:MAG: hypothetical protein JNM62_00145 [Flavobacteriales bacterium]|nr:hypothetical protein [Flavobacteriales bacterium]
MSARTILPRTTLAAALLLSTAPVFAQGSENAIGAAVVFGALVCAAVVAGFVISVLYVFKRRRWQRAVVLVFGAALLVVGQCIGIQPGSSGDMDFLRLLLSGAGVLLLLLGTVLRARPQAPVSSAER